MEWFEKFGWRMDPLDWSIPSNFLIGLDEQNKLLQELIDRRKLIVVQGQTGTGKTTLVKQAIENNKKYHGVYLMGNLLIGEPNKNLKKEVTKLKFLLFKKPIVLVIDEATKTPFEILEQVQGLFDTQKVKSVVLVQISDDLSKYPATLRGRLQASNAHVKTDVLEKEQLYDLLDKRLDGKLDKLFDKEAVMAIIKSCGGVPRSVMGMCSDILAQTKGIKASLRDAENLLKTGGVKISDVAGSYGKPYGTSGVSPVQEKICALLETKPRTYVELSEQLQKPVTTISKDIFRLMKQGKVIKLNSKPAKFNLEPGFKFQRISDGGK